MSEAPEDLGAFLDDAWQLIGRGTVDSKSAANRPALATVGAEGPAVRTVVLRAADREAGTLDIHSHRLAGKVAELRAEPRAALHVWDAKRSLQMRLAGAATVHVEDAAARAAFDALPEHGRTIYAVSPEPAAEIDAPSAPAFDADPWAGFALIRLRLERIELLHLGRERHSRAVYERSSGWRGRWLVP
ncbi:pyridoxamine 5'-phosphate oxidase family protein [Pontivivens ytuae]|uniref:Pyridoxamine 5'-phosphate oxidase family protein n=1 Tax=Pontivivens ytuae TaxID=2789856 RepID=A0A7S9LU23_9RHOB|nr:pyridoxamine 5'-phosphate oxidase family protein [Pontivivens ytuae]QPH55168.1 pyridoxamine 5'-phosphate oxidase family protein [Pontivivens ytuae]